MSKSFSENIVLAHLSDLHLGYAAGFKTDSNGVNLREMDGYRAFHTMVGDILAARVDAVLVAGDVFHTPTPTVRTIVEAQKEFRRLADAKIPVYILTGNHDTSDVQSELAATVLLNDPEHGIYGHCEPYATHTIGSVKLHLVSHHLYQYQNDTWDKVEPDPNCFNVFSTHGSLIDPITHLRLHTDASPREVIIPDELVDKGWNSILLGHIHERKFVKTSVDGLQAYYNGSLIRRGFSDGVTSLGRGWTMWTINTSDGTISGEFKTISQRPQYDFPTIDAKSLSADEVSGLILGNLSSALRDADANAEDTDFEPILRQKVVNLTLAKRAALNLQTISETAKNAFTWTLKTSKPEVEEKIVTNNNTTANNGDIRSSYDAWSQNYNVYEQVRDNIRGNVEEQTKSFIKQAANDNLDKESVA